MASKNALLEIGTEELPAGYIQPALEQMSRLALEGLHKHGLKYVSVATYATPRRLALLIEGLEEKGEDRAEEFTGPAAKVWKDEQGNFTQAAKGFAAKYNYPVEKLTVKMTDRGEYLSISRRIPGEKTEKVLPVLFPEIVSKIAFPKSMVWEPSKFRFARPVRSLMGIYGDKIVKFSLAGIKSANWTTGLHTISSKRIVVTTPEKYVTTLRNNCVIADPAERREVLAKVVDGAAKRTKGNVIADEGLIDEVNFLVEHPVAVLGRFDEKYLKLPSEILITCLRKKQKFFAVNDADGRLSNAFIGIRNGISEHQEIVREGYERVLTARLDDAAFFFTKDTATPLMAKFEKLKGVVFQQKLGSVSDKMGRVEELALAVNEMLAGTPHAADAGDIRTAARLAKADLVTDMVYEYPELQGAIGRIYAEHAGIPKEVARAIEEHYWPLSAEGQLPDGKVATILSIADKIDTLVGDFAVGLVPSGSADPYGLRRMAAGVVRMILEKKLPIKLMPLFEKALSSLPQGIRDNRASLGQLLAFFGQRLEGVFEAKGYKFDEVRAVLASGIDNFVDVEQRLAAVKAVRSHADFEPLAGSFKRAANILKQAAKNKADIPAGVQGDLLKEEAEKNLFEHLRTMEQDVTGLINAADYRAALQKMVSLKPFVDTFFDKVMVMAEDPAVRGNRLALLASMVRLFSRILDFSVLQS